MRHRCCKHVVNAFERTQQTSLLRLKPSPQAQRRRLYATVKDDKKTLAVKSRPRHNQLGVQQLSAHLHPQLFPDQHSQPDPELVALSKAHLEQHGLLGKAGDEREAIAFDMPALQGASLDEHFHRLGMDCAEPYLTFAKKYSRASPPEKPRNWARRSGWTKYKADGSWEAVEAPDEDAITFDTEVMWLETNYPAMACAVSATHWYAWLSPWLLGESSDDKHLIPLGSPDKARVVIGHNIGYDRARVREEYDLQLSKNFYLDTMSLHVAVNGMCSQQRPTWMKHRKARELQDQIAASDDAAQLTPLLEPGGLPDEEADLWVGRSSCNSLRDVAKFHCGITIDKARRDLFGELDREGVLERVDELLDYCAADVEITHKVYRKVFPAFLETCPHSVSFAALRHLSAEILPVNHKWNAYIHDAEATYHRLSSAVEQRLVDLAEKAVDQRSQSDYYLNDPWLSQLDWGGQEVRMVKGKKKGEAPRPAARQKKPGMPHWYKDLFARNDSPIALTVRTRIAPLLLRLAWDEHPLVWSDKYGWTFRVRWDDATKYREQAMTECDMREEPDNPRLYNDAEHAYFKLPHRDGPSARCASPLAKGYLPFFESGTLSSEFPCAREALDMNASCSYWISARDRIMRQMVVYDRDRLDEKRDPNSERGFILPQVIPMGTITRRAVENTWLTAANAKHNRVGSELKSMITAPPGYSFVGADVDSQELWIAALTGDASFQLHGGNAIGFMTLEGTKAAGTEFHSHTAKILGISRNDAKIFNYGRIYGAGLKFAQSLLRRFNPSLKEADATRIAGDLYRETKGKRERRRAISERAFWRGGTESLVFNKLEEFAEQERPRTPVLGAGITEALMRRFIGGKGNGNFMTSRINWAIQSSGVDYLHLLIVSMDYLCRRFDVPARLSLTVHDEIRYLVPSAARYRCAMALQVANVWTRAMFSAQMGIPDLPQACAFFSAVDIDHVLRKEVDMPCVTPSHPAAIAPGESLDIAALLAKGRAAYLDPHVVARPDAPPPRPLRFPYTPRVPVMQTLRTAADPRAYLRAQIAPDTDHLNRIAKQVKAPASSSPPAPHTLHDRPVRLRKIPTGSRSRPGRPRQAPAPPSQPPRFPAGAPARVPRPRAAAAAAATAATSRTEDHFMEYADFYRQQEREEREGAPVRAASAWTEELMWRAGSVQRLLGRAGSAQR